MDFVFYGVDFKHEKGEFCQRRSIPYHFISCFRTDFSYEADGKLLFGKSGDMLILPRGAIVYHGPTPEMHEGFRNDWMYISGEEFVSLVEQYSLPVGKPFCVGGSRALAVTIEKIHKELSFAYDGYREMCDMYMREAVIELHRAYLRGMHETTKDKFDRLRGEMAREPKNKWSLASMAEFCGYSESRFSALYRQYYKISPMADLIHIRIENAKLLLAYSDMKVLEIAEAVGFASVYYFSKCFKMSLGVTPKEYRKAPSRG